MSESSFDIHTIIHDKLLTAVFQPIISFRTSSIIGYEGLIRGLNRNPEEGLIPPLPMIEKAEKEGVSLEFDRICRETVIKTFTQHVCKSESCLLFLNINSSVIEEGVVGSRQLMRTVEKSGLDNRNIVIELVESKVKETSALVQFAEFYRKQGFLIGLDDFGTGESGYERLNLLSPDIIKIDRSLVNGICEMPTKEEIFRSICRLGFHSGALVLAEGVESEAEAYRCLEAGANLFQGFLFGKPDTVDPVRIEKTLTTMRSCKEQFKSLFSRKLEKRRHLFRNHQEVMEVVISALAKHPQSDYQKLLIGLIGICEGIECLYILDNEGCMVTDTVFHQQSVLTGENRFSFSAPLFAPARYKDDLSLKDYFLHVHCGIDTFTSEPYVSLATGKRCITIARKFLNSLKQEMILCADFRDTP